MVAFPVASDLHATHRIVAFVLFLILSGLGGAFAVRPRVRFEYELKERGIPVEVRVADAFNTDGALVVPTNDLFRADIKGRMVDRASIQSALIRNHFGNKPARLQAKINDWLKDNAEKYETNQEEQNDGEFRTNYAIGDVVQIRKDGRLFYLLANTHISTEGAASSDKDELLNSLQSLWEYIATEGYVEDNVVPLIGSQHSRLTLTREEVLQHILRTFVASCSDRTYCKKLTIVIYPPDVRNHKIDLQFIDEMLRSEIKLAYYAASRD